MQKHLQLRIEAQGKYLQSVLKKAQEALAGYNSSPVGLELTKAELSQLVTIINNACPSSPTSEITETRGLSLNYVEERKRDRGTMCSLESSLTSSESSGRKEEKRPMEEIGDFKSSNNVSLELPLMEIHSEDKASNEDLSNEANGRKRSATTQSDGCSSCVVEQPCEKRCGNKLRKTNRSEMFDLNSQCQSDMDSTSSKTLDLNFRLNFGEP